LEWRWFKSNPITFQVFLYILLKANVKPGDFGTVRVLRGQLITSYNRIATDLDISIAQARTAISHLKSTGEITCVAHTKYSVITVVNYSKYQGMTTNKSQANNKQTTGKQQQSKKDNKTDKKKDSAGGYAPKYWELDIPKQAWGRFETEAEWDQWKENHIKEVTAWLTN